MRNVHTEIKLTRNKATFSIERKMIDAPYIIIIIILKFQLTVEEKPLFLSISVKRKKLINFSRRQREFPRAHFSLSFSSSSFAFLPLPPIIIRFENCLLEISTFHNESYLDFNFYGAY
jgi:hypothetical protein